MYQLEAQFPKLIDCGGFELIRAEKGGSKELQPIEVRVGVIHVFESSGPQCQGLNKTFASRPEHGSLFS